MYELTKDRGRNISEKITLNLGKGSEITSLRNTGMSLWVYILN